MNTNKWGEWKRQYSSCGTSLPIKGWCLPLKRIKRREDRWSLWSLTCHLIRVTFTILRFILKCIPRSFAFERQSIATVRTSWVRGLDNKRTINKGRQTLAKLAAIEAIRERARIDDGTLVERMITVTSMRIKSLSEISNLDRQSIIYQCDVSRLYRNNGRNLPRDYVSKLNRYSVTRLERRSCNSVSLLLFVIKLSTEIITLFEMI